MRYSTFFKFVAFVLCAAALLGMVGSAAGIFFLTELGGKSVDEYYTDQLQSQALGYGFHAAEIYASEELGDAPGDFLNYQYGNDWESWFFDWRSVGYTLYDGQGNILREKELPDSSRGIGYEFTNLVVGGRYMKVLAVAPWEEHAPQPSEPPRMEARVLVMPAQETTAIGEVYVDYPEGRREAWPADGTQLGILCLNGGNTVTFVSNIGEFPVGDGWYPNHVLMLDMGGNVVYEVAGDGNVVLGSELDDDYGCRIHLPAGTVTTVAPTGQTYTDGDYTSYDAIPAQGATVTSMNISYANAQGEMVGSEGVASPDLIGTVFHNVDGNAEFRSNSPMTMDIPDGCILTGIAFIDAQQNMLFEASCPGGVGTLEYDQDGYMIFRGRMPGTGIPEEIPHEETGEMPEESAGKIGFAREKLNIYRAPSPEAEIVGSVEAWEELSVSARKTFDGVRWGRISEGWILMEKVLLEEADAESFAIPRDTEAEAGIPDTAEETLPESQEDPSAPAENPAAQTAPVQTDSETENVTAPEEEVLPVETVSDHPVEGSESGLYYDSALGQHMVAEYVWEPLPEGYTITVRLAPDALRNELGWTLLRLAERYETVLLEALGICAAVLVLCVIHLCCSAGRTRRTAEVRAGGLNRIPLDLYLAGSGFAVVGLAAAALYGSQYLARNDEQLAIVFCGVCCYALCAVIVGFCFAFVAQIKTPGGFWWRNSICGRCLKLSAVLWNWFRKACVFIRRNGKPVLTGLFGGLLGLVITLCRNLWKAILWLRDTAGRGGCWLWSRVKKIWGWAIGKLVHFFSLLPVIWQFLLSGFVLVLMLYVMMRTYKVGYILLGFGIFFGVILYAASAFGILLESARHMSRGNLDTKVDDRLLIGGFKDFAVELNELADVAVVAAQKQMKSERMKTELITNVSHDIKTPLTSIINYVDLMEKPHTPEEQAAYLEVLSRQSQRLKKLIDDLMEMSKASTGNMSVDIQRVNAAEAVNQALGEFGDKLERAQLIPVFRHPEKDVEMMADGRLVWRVMSNLLGNAVKYAMPGTRMYLDLTETDGKVILSMKNISREELNVTADELLERFVRGDASRNTEGSGLGLNIAKSLMELQKGQLQLLVDGDLFKVTLIFPGA